MCACMFVWACVHAGVHVYVNVHVFACAHIRVFVCVYVQCMCGSVRASMCVFSIAQNNRYLGGRHAQAMLM